MSTAPASFVTAPPTISQTTESAGWTPGSGSLGGGGGSAEQHYAPPHTRGFMPR